MRREHVFRLRLGDEERDDLDRRAAAEGIAKADVIRNALGWEAEGLIRRRDPDQAPAAPAAPSPPPDPDAGPGQRGLSLLTQRIAARRG